MDRTCAHCHRPIEWAVTWRLDEDHPSRHHSWMPIDPAGAGGDVEPNVAVHRSGATLRARVLTADRYVLHYEQLRTTHFATCPARHRTATSLPSNVIPLRRPR